MSCSLCHAVSHWRPSPHLRRGRRGACDRILDRPLVLWQALVGPRSSGKSCALAPSTVCSPGLEAELKGERPGRRSAHRNHRSGQHSDLQPSARRALVARRRLVVVLPILPSLRRPTIRRHFHRKRARHNATGPPPRGAGRRERQLCSPLPVRLARSATILPPRRAASARERASLCPSCAASAAPPARRRSRWCWFDEAAVKAFDGFLTKLDVARRTHPAHFCNTICHKQTCAASCRMTVADPVADFELTVLVRPEFGSERASTNVPLNRAA